MIPIAGAANQSFAPLVNGSYAAEVTNSICVDTSACHFVGNVGIAEQDSEFGFSVYPNPTTGSFVVALGRFHTGVGITIHNVLGQVVTWRYYQRVDSFSSDLPEAPGVYFVELMTDEGLRAVVRIVKE